MTRLRSGKSGIRFQVVANGVYYIPNFRSENGAHPNFSSFIGGKGREVDFLPPIVPANFVSCIKAKFDMSGGKQF